MIEPEDLVGPEWAQWYRLTPQERFRESEKLWATFLMLGGSLDRQPACASPFFDPDAPFGPDGSPEPIDGRPGVRVIRRSGV